jgi:hypothetical protein
MCKHNAERNIGKQNSNFSSHARRNNIRFMAQFVQMRKQSLLVIRLLYNAVSITVTRMQDYV